MGYITNQWLVGSPERNRDHSLVHVTINCNFADDEWFRSHNVVARIDAVRSTGEYHELYLQETDLGGVVLPQMARRVDIASRRQIAHDFLVELDDAGLLETLSRVLERRMANRASQSTPASGRD